MKTKYTIAFFVLGVAILSAPLFSTAQELYAPAPTNLSAAPEQGGVPVKLNWIDNATDEEYFYVYWKQEGGSYNFLVKLDPNTTSHDHYEAPVGNLTYYVEACNIYGCNISNTALASVTSGSGGSGSAGGSDGGGDGGGSFSCSSTSGWISKIWQFSDGSQSWCILDRTDSEYTNFIASVETQCASVSTSDYTWYAGAGDDTNWQEFGIPNCSGEIAPGGIDPGDTGGTWTDPGDTGGTGTGTTVADYPFTFPSNLTCSYYEACYDWCTQVPGAHPEDIESCDLYFPGATYEGGGSNWINKTWLFADGSIESAILNRTDQEYLDYIAEVEARCVLIPKDDFFWSPDAGNDNNWQEFGIPNCTGEGEVLRYGFFVDTFDTFPKDGDEFVGIDTRIEIKFSDAIDKGDVLTSYVKFTESQSPDSFLSASVSADRNRLLVIPTEPLKIDTTYTYTVLPGIKSIEGETFDETFSASFKTGDGTLASFAQLSGKIVGPSKNPVTGAFVEVHTSSWSVSRGSPTDTLGEYFIRNIPAGEFLVDVYPPESISGLISPETEKYTFRAGDFIIKNYAFKPAAKKITGTVKRADGTAVANVRIGAFQSSTSRFVGTETNSLGEYSLSVSGGSWNVQIEPSREIADWTWVRKEISVTFSDDASIEEKTVSFVVVDADATISGSVLLPDGSIPPEYTISVEFRSGKGGMFSDGVKSDGTFSIRVVAGTYTISIHNENQLYDAPPFSAVTVTTGDSKNVGVITLVERSEKITGSVVDEGGRGLSGVHVSAWQPSGGSYASTETIKDGSFVLNVSSGEWEVEVTPDDSLLLYSSDPPKEVVVDSGRSVSLKFVLKKADARVSGTVVDGNGDLLTDAYGFMSLSTGDSFSKQGPEVGGPIERGKFSFAAPSGTYEALVFFSPDSPYITSKPQTIVLSEGETKTLTMVVVTGDSTITGSLVDESGEIITGVSARIFGGTHNGIWREARFNSSDGTYEMKVSPGTWYLGYEVKAENGYVSVESRTSVVIESGETVVQNVVVSKADSVLSGTVSDPDGNPIAHVFVGISETGFADTIEGGVMKDPIVSGADTNSDGSYSVSVPAGTYFLKAFVHPDTGFINSKENKLIIAKGESKTLDLSLRRSDSFITGKVLLNSSPVSNAFVWGWSKTGGYQETFVQVDGTFRLNVTTDETWIIAAAYDKGGVFYKSSETPIKITGGSIRHDISLGSPQKTPDSASKTTDATQTTVIETSDGTSVVAPANAISTSGSVNISATPDTRAPSQGEIKVVGSAYNLEARDSSGTLITTFNTDVTVSLTYDVSNVTKLGATEDHLSLGFWDESAGTWVPLDSSIVNKEEKKVVGSTNHFTRFAIIASADISPPDTPTNMLATAVGNGAITVTWENPSSDFDHAKVYRSEEEGVLGTTRAVEVFATSFTDSGSIIDKTTYFYTVRAVDGAGNETDNLDQTSVVAVGSSEEELSDDTGLIPPELVIQTSFERNLKVGSTGPDVIALQKLLVEEGVYPEALTTGYFGGLTRAAVARFQNKYKDEILTPVGLSNGTGFFGPSTRKKANERAGGAYGTTASGPAQSDVGVSVSDFARNLTVGGRGADVKALQEFLNNQGFAVSESGPGSLGNETTYFGNKTKEALITFQDAYKDDILSPVGLSKGTGFFGPSTRKKIKEISE